MGERVVGLEGLRGTSAVVQSVLPPWLRVRRAQVAVHVVLPLPLRARRPLEAKLNFFKNWLPRPLPSTKTLSAAVCVASTWGNRTARRAGASIGATPVSGASRPYSGAHSRSLSFVGTSVAWKRPVSNLLITSRRAVFVVRTSTRIARSGCFKARQRVRVLKPPRRAATQWYAPTWAKLMEKDPRKDTVTTQRSGAYQMGIGGLNRRSRSAGRQMAMRQGKKSRRSCVTMSWHEASLCQSVSRKHLSGRWAN